MIEDLFDKMVDVKRLVDDSGNTEVYDDHIDDLPCCIQPVEPAYSQDIDGSFGQDWLMLCNVVDILEGDRIAEGSIEYKVIGVESFELFGEPQHMELTIRREKQ